MIDAQLDFMNANGTGSYGEESIDTSLSILRRKGYPVADSSQPIYKVLLPPEAGR